MEKHSIIALVGPSGAGKTTLMDAAIRQMPDRLGRIVSFTTRLQRNAEDTMYYEFVNHEEVEKRKKAGIVVQLIEFNGNYYGTDRPHIDGILKDKFGILAVVEHGLKTFTDAGYNLIVVKIIPEGYIQPENRRAADEERAKIPIRIDKTIVNSFSPGGLEKATSELVAFLQSLS